MPVCKRLLAYVNRAFRAMQRVSKKWVFGLWQIFAIFHADLLDHMQLRI